MEEDEEQRYEVKQKKNNTIHTWGNATTMNINSMIHTNILQSPYFKNELFKLKTYHEVIDEIYYKVDHLEPWEKGSRKTSGQVGMCGGVRGVGAGGIVSTSYCLLFKLFTLKLTRKQLKGLLDHPDSPYIRALGFMYIRYCLQPSDYWEWYQPYLEDEEELDVKAGGGCIMTVGQLVRSFMLKIDWYGTLFPRIPVPAQKALQQKLTSRNLCDDHKRKADEGFGEAERYSKTKREETGSGKEEADGFGEAEKYAKMRRFDSGHRERSPGYSKDRDSSRRRSRSRERHQSSRHGRERSRSRERSSKSSRNGEDRRRKRSRSHSVEKTSKHADRRQRSRSREKHSKSKRKHRSRSRERSLRT